MPFIVDDLGAWLIALLADAGRAKLTRLVFGSEQERALRQVATTAIRDTAQELRPGGGGQAEELAMVVSEVLGLPLPEGHLRSQPTLLEALQAGIAGQLATLNDRALTGVKKSSAEILEVSGAELAQKLTGHLVQEIVIAAGRGGPLSPLAAQLNHDVTHIQSRRVEGKVDRLNEGLLEVMAWLDSIRTSVEAAPSDNSGDADSLTMPVQAQQKSLPPIWESLRRETIALEFENGTNLVTPRILALLEDYYPEVLNGNLSGFTFSSTQLKPKWGSEYQRIREVYAEYHGREGLQLRRLEQYLIEGVRILLDITYIRQKQTLFSMVGLSSFARLMRHRSIALIRSQLPEELRGVNYRQQFFGNPLSSNSQAAQFYGRDVMLIDLWKPEDPRHVLKCWLPRDGYAGSWFSQSYGLPPDGYTSHYHPPEHYGYILPQAATYLLVNGDPIPADFNDYMIGPG